MLTKQLIFAGLVALMLSMGMKLTFRELAAAFSRPQLIGQGILANYLLVPAITLALLKLLGTEALVSAGFLILAACPAAPIGPPFVVLAKGDEPAAVGQMVILSGLSPFLSPALVTLLIAAQQSQGICLDMDYLAIARTLLVAQLLPFGMGLAIAHAAPKIASKLVRPLGLLAVFMLLGAIGVILVREFGILSAIRLRGWAAMLLLFAMTLAIGWISGGRSEPTRRALAITTAARNIAVALVIVASSAPDSPAVTAVIAYGLVTLFGTFALALCWGMRRSANSGPSMET